MKVWFARDRESDYKGLASALGPMLPLAYDQQITSPHLDKLKVPMWNRTNNALSRDKGESMGPVHEASDGRGYALETKERSSKALRQDSTVGSGVREGTVLASNDAEHSPGDAALYRGLRNSFGAEIPELTALYCKGDITVGEWTHRVTERRRAEEKAIVEGNVLASAGSDFRDEQSVGKCSFAEGCRDGNLPSKKPTRVTTFT